MGEYGECWSGLCKPTVQGAVGIKEDFRSKTITTNSAFFHGDVNGCSCKYVTASIKCVL